MVENVGHCSRQAFNLIIARGCLDGLAWRTSGALMRGAFLDGITCEELAPRMSVPLGTMQSWIRRMQAHVILRVLQRAVGARRAVGDVVGLFDRFHAPAVAGDTQAVDGTSSARSRSARSSGLPGWHRNRRLCARPSHRPPAKRPRLRCVRPRYARQRRIASRR